MKPLKPVMAALLAAASATFALPGISSATTPKTDSSVKTPASAPLKKPAADCSALDTLTDPVYLISCLAAQDPAVRADIGERLARFVSSKDSGHQYMTDGLLADAVNLPPTLAIAKGWPEANKDKPGSVATLYFVIGGDDAGVPAWAQKYPLLAKTLQTKMKWSGRLAEALAVKQWNAAKQIPQSGAAEAMNAFLGDATIEAAKVFADKRTKDEIVISVGANDTTAVDVPTTPASKNPLDTTGSGFGFDDLYRNGAVTGNVFAKNDAGYRELSVKIYTSKDSAGNLINKIGIVDITNPDSPSLPQFIDAAKAGDHEITMKEGGRPYVVSVGEDGGVTLKRSGAKDGDPGTITTSTTELSAKRNAQIMASGTITIGGEPYYVLGQGGEKGSYLFFPQYQMQANPKGNAHPMLMGEVAQVLSDGSTSPLKGKQDIGTVANGDPYHLEIDPATHLWKVAFGPGDKKKGGDAGGDTPAGSTTTTTGGGATKPTGTTDDPYNMGAAKSLDDLISIAKSAKPGDPNQVWGEDAGNKGFDAASSALVRIMSNKQPDNMTHFLVLFDPTFDVHNNHFEFQPLANDVRLYHVRGVKKYAAIEYATNTQYFDLKNFASYVQHVYDPSLSYVQAGSYAKSNNQMQNVTDVDIMEDILVHHMKVKEGDPMIATLRARVAKNAKSAGYVINGDTNTIYLGSGETGMTIWPKELAAGDTGTNAGMTGLRGPGTAVAVSAGEPGDFKATMDLGAGKTSVRDQAENHAALYVSDEEENDKGNLVTNKVYSIMLEYKKNGLDSRTKALPVFGGLGRFAKPAAGTLHMQGLPGVDMPDTAQLMLQYGSTQENGAIAAYRNVLPDAQGGSNVKDKAANCAGPVLWWGNVTKEQAQAACAGTSKIR